ncbi:hypothetical protein [Nocardia wallacei]|uniref:hypothetical protein n=1 Tax=Nocardia wallacei TaxID=480035 RepID=UPI00245837FC|nr:hypothetical protein [Nocardia wallacei]
MTTNQRLIQLADQLAALALSAAATSVFGARELREIARDAIGIAVALTPDSSPRTDEEIATPGTGDALHVPGVVPKPST